MKKPLFLFVFFFTMISVICGQEINRDEYIKNRGRVFSGGSNRVEEFVGDKRAIEIFEEMLADQKEYLYWDYLIVATGFISNGNERVFNRLVEYLENPSSYGVKSADMVEREKIELERIYVDNKINALKSFYWIVKMNKGTRVAKQAHSYLKNGTNSTFWKNRIHWQAANKYGYLQGEKLHKIMSDLCKDLLRDLSTKK